MRVLGIYKQIKTTKILEKMKWFQLNNNYIKVQGI